MGAIRKELMIHLGVRDIEAKQAKNQGRKWDGNRIQFWASADPPKV